MWLFEIFEIFHYPFVIISSMIMPQFIKQISCIKRTMTKDAILFT